MSDIVIRFRTAGTRQSGFVLMSDDIARGESDIIERLRKPTVAGFYHVTNDALRNDAADYIERLEERCEAYKGQVKAGADEIERLCAALEEIAGDPTGVSSYQADIAKRVLGDDWICAEEIERLEVENRELKRLCSYPVPGAEFVRAATIEECAQIANEYAGAEADAIAFRIRALKEQKGS